MIPAWLARAALGADAFAKQHPHGLTTGVVGLLLGFAAAAFGIAPRLPDPADLPRRVISEQVASPGLVSQLEALADHTVELSRSDTTRVGDTADSLLKRLGVVDGRAAAFLRIDPVARRLFDGKAGKMVQARADRDGALRELVARYALDGQDRLGGQFFTRLTVRRDAASGDSSFVARVEVAPLESQVRLASGTVRTSFFAASDEARIPDAVATQIAQMFSTDIDFHREILRGDTFSVVYEAPTADGEPIGWSDAGRVLAAEFVNGGQAYQALWWRGNDGRGAYFGFDGTSKRRTFLPSPMEFSRITSGFAMRFHPILQSWRAHLGVDYGAPFGTPVRSVGDGLVEFAGVQNGYGNVIQLRHDGERTTLYAHLSRVDVRAGQRVEQGQRIGAVGATGWATGPHLHFEFRVNGQHQDPLKVSKASEPVVVAPAARAEFARLASGLHNQLDMAETLAGASDLAGE